MALLHGNRLHFSTAEDGVSEEDKKRCKKFQRAGEWMLLWFYLNVLRLLRRCLLCDSWQADAVIDVAVNVRLAITSSQTHELVRANWNRTRDVSEL